MEKQDHHAARKVRHGALKRKADGNAARGEQCEERGGLDAKNAEAHQNEDDIQHDAAAARCERSEARVHFLI